MNRRSALAAGAALLVCLPALARAGAASSAPLALDGIDPVSYFDPGKPEKGSARIGYDYGGHRYLFVSEKHRAAFAADPQRYLPQFGEPGEIGRFGAWDRQDHWMGPAFYGEARLGHGALEYSAALLFGTSQAASDRRAVVRLEYEF